MLLCQTVYLFLPDAHREITPERRRLVVKSTVGEVSFREPETSRDNEEIKSLKFKLLSVVSGLNRGFMASVDDLQRAETQRLFFASSTNFVYALHLSSFQNGRDCAKGLPVVICSIDLEAGDFITAFDYLAEKESLLIGTSRGLLIVHEARKIEAQLDEQMHLYHRLVSTKSDGEESDLEAGIDLLLRQFQQVNAQMQAWVPSGGSEMVSHTLTRHQEIVQDLTQTSSSSAKTALVFNAMDPKTPLISVNMAGINKLTTNNYITWTFQLRALLEAHELHCFIDQAENTPSATVVTNGVEKLNPLFAPWKRQDIMLYSAILGTLSPNVQPIVSSATTTKEIWTVLAGTYGTHSRRRIKQIKQELKRSVKGTQTVDEYMKSIIKTADELAVLGAPVEHEDLLDIITDGLGDDYRAIVEMVNGRDIPITLDELHEKLVEREHTLLTTGVSSSASSSSTHVTVSVKGQDEEEHRVFRMRRNDKMSKVMERYNDARGAELGTYVFLSEGGSMINKDKTPDEMEIKDGYQIDAMLHQHGGFGPSSIKF